MRYEYVIYVDIHAARGTHEAEELTKLPTEVDWWDRTRAECTTSEVENRSTAERERSTAPELH